MNDFWMYASASTQRVLCWRKGNTAVADVIVSIHVSMVMIGAIVVCVIARMVDFVVIKFRVGRW
jgi:hypothetical protein